MSTLLQDVRYALRMLVKNPGFAIVAVLTLAVGIGANTAIFSLVDAVLLRPLPGIKQPEQLVSLYRMQKNDPFDVFGYPDYVDYRNRDHSFSGLTAYSGTAMNLGGDNPEQVRGEVVTGNYFSALGVEAAQGRLIDPNDDIQRGAHPVAVLSFDLWQRNFGADPAAVGRTVLLNSFPFTVIGIAPRGFAGTMVGEPFDIWVPTSMLDQAMPRATGHNLFEERAWGWMHVFGRLKPGVSVEQAQAGSDVIARQLQLAYPATNAGRTVTVVQGVGLDPEDRSNLRSFLGLLSGGVGLVLLITCANVAGLLLVRAGERQREIAVRLAVGASRGRLIRQLVTEGLLLAGAGGCLGLLLAPWAVSLSLARTESLLRYVDARLDGRVLAFTFVVSLLAGIAFALAPALLATTPDLAHSMKAGALGVRRQSPLQRLLAAAQVALSFVLLISAGLLLRSIGKILRADPGYGTRNVLTMSVDPAMNGYSPARGEAFYQQLLERLNAIPGVVSATAATSIPPEEWPGAVSVFYPGQEPPQNALRGNEMHLGIRVNIVTVAPRYFQTLGVPSIEGRDFAASDRQIGPLRDQDGNIVANNALVDADSARGVAIINHKLAERLWPGESALGKRIAWPTLVGPSRAPLEVVGVVQDSKYRSLVSDPPLLMYVPLSQNYPASARLIIRTASAPAEMVSAVRREIAALDKNLAVYNVETMQDRIAWSLWRQRTAASLMSSFGLLAVLLATLGLYGVVAHAVGQRTREIGIRMALGAQRQNVVRLVIADGAVLTLVGIGVGAVAALGLTRFLATLLYGVSPGDPASFVGASAALALVALAACWIPARRATKVDPMVALRYE